MSCIDVLGEMYRSYNLDSYYVYVSFDGERFLLNESKLEKAYLTDFTQEEISSCCLPYHMAAASYTSYYWGLINATDVRGHEIIMEN